MPTTQPEQVLEDYLVAQLMEQGHTRAVVRDEVTMLSNLKTQVESLAMSNCVATYESRIRSGLIYFYQVLKPQRGTLQINCRSDGLEAAPGGRSD